MSTTKISVPGDLVVGGETDATGETIARSGVRLTSSSGPLVLSGADDPNTSVSAELGSLYARTDGGELWQNTSSPSPGTTWTKIVGGSLPFSGVSVYSTEAFVTTYPYQIYNALKWDVEKYDTDNYHRPGQQTRLYAPANGYYRVTAGLRTNAGQTLLFALAKNQAGGTAILSPFCKVQVRNTNGWGEPSIETVVKLNAEDYIEAFFWTWYAGGDLWMDPAFPFTMERLG